jgi:mRNA interferase YafQ
MRAIDRAAAFKGDYKRAKASPRHRQDVDRLVSGVVDLLVADQDFPHLSRDHALVGDWSRYRECHLKPDLLRIYRKPDVETVRLARLGSHSDLFV